MSKRFSAMPASAPVSASALGKPVIVSENLTIGYTLHRERKRLTALRDISLTVNRGEFVVLVGPSGCGKTTFINAVSGLVQPWEGTIEVNGKPVTGPGPDRAMVFQDYALMPWRTVESNVRLPFEFQNLGLSKAEMDERVDRFLELVGLSAFKKILSLRAFGRHEAARRHRSRIGYRAGYPAGR